MAVKRGGLGKGLDSLIPDHKHDKLPEKTVQLEKTPEKKKDFEIRESGEQMVKITKVEPNREQPRRNFEDCGRKKMESCKDSWFERSSGNCKGIYRSRSCRDCID